MDETTFDWLTLFDFLWKWLEDSIKIAFDIDWSA